jgi:F0F1-type ATP synthase assembly protein I
MSEDGKPGEERGSEVVRASSQFLGHGMTFAASVALFGWIGFKIGERIGAESLLMILGMLLGGAAGFYNLYVQVVIRPREEQGSEESDDD